MSRADTKRRIWLEDSGESGRKRWGERVRFPFLSNIEITCNVLNANETLQDYAMRALHALWTTRDLEMLEERAIAVNGLPALSMRFAWTDELGALEQCVTFVEAPPDEETGERPVITFTATSPRHAAAFVRPFLERMLGGGMESPATRLGELPADAVTKTKRSTSGVQRRTP